MHIGMFMNVENPEALLLIGIDVAQASIGGGGTAMRFVLPVHATTKAQDIGVRTVVEAP
jgi:hypothetical protein